MRFTSIIIITLALILSTVSCKKEAATVASIKVINTDGSAISDAFVRLYGTSTTDPQRQNILDDTLYTNANGIAKFDYTDYFKLGQAGFTVLDIEVKSEVYTGIGIIKIEEEKINEETVILQ